MSMKSLTLILLLFALPAISQPVDMREPCPRENRAFDFNQDGITDAVLYLGSEGTDDEPSSSGMCNYHFSLVEGNFLSIDQEVLVEATNGSVFTLSKLTALHAHSGFMSTIACYGYGGQANIPWQSRLETGAHYFLFEFQTSPETVKYGVIKLTITAESSIEIDYQFMTGDKLHIAFAN